MARFAIQIEKGDGSAGNADGHRWTVRLRGEIIAQGWDAGSKREARAEARRRLEEMGLITDGE